MRSLAEINQEYTNQCVQIGDLYVKKENMQGQINQVMARMQHLDQEATARRMFDAEKAREAAEGEKKSQDQTSPQADTQGQPEQAEAPAQS